MSMEVIYHPHLVALSILVAIFASYVALNMAYSVTQAVGRLRVIWLIIGSLAMGVGIWSMHFIGMLAFEMPGMEMAYDIPLMALSIVVAILGSALALFVVSRPVVSLRSLLASTVAMAAAISGMHYIGMYSMRMEARIEWDYILVFLSIVIALVASFAALTICIRLRNKPDRFLLLGFASTLMGIAIAGMHYTGMVAATFIHDHSGGSDATDLSVGTGLTFTTLFATLFILGLALMGSIGQRLWAIRQKQNEEILGTSEEKYRLLVEAVKDYAIYMIDPQGHITTWNRGAHRITGYSEEEILGKHISTFYTQEDVDADAAGKELTTALENGHFEGEAIRVRKDGTKFWSNIVIDPLFDRNGTLSGYSKVTRDITALKAAEARTRSINEELEVRVRERTVALQERELQLRTITNAIPILVAQVDRSERLLFANGSFCDWFDRLPREINKLTFRDVLGEDRYPSNKPYIDRALNGETVSYERLSKSGTREAMLNITFVPELNDDGQVKGFIIVAADVSNYKRIEIELKSAKDLAEVANETKSAFLANMSHEIRTPLGAVLGFSELLLDSAMTENDRVKSIEIIKRNGKLLSTIINDILDLSKVEAGKLEFERVDVKLLELLNELAVLLNLEAEGKGVKLMVASDGVIPTVVRTDPTRLRQILFNVIGNAIKFTERGSVRVTVKVDPQNVSKLQFVIQDTGTGIASEHIGRLFAPFTQADVTTTRRFGGTGLGLILSKKLANALGGDVELVESQLDKGSTFVVSIDHGRAQDVFIVPSTSAEKMTRQSAEASAQTARTMATQKRLSSLNVLVVDDSPDNLALITRILNISGATVQTASGGAEGIAKATQDSIDVVLMDLQMPEMDGYEATRELRRRGFKKPIIALTAHAMKEERKRCLESGFNDHMTKPIDRDLLVQRLADLHATH